jgi:hypothetical protein
LTDFGVDMDDNLQKAYDRAIQMHLAKEDVTGIIVGLKFKDGQWTDEQCIAAESREGRRF